MTAQWNGRLRNARVFNRALTDVSPVQIYFEREGLTVRCAGGDHRGVQVDRLRSFSHCNKVAC